MEHSEDSRREGGSGKERERERERERDALRGACFCSFISAGSYLSLNGFSDFSQGRGSTLPSKQKLDQRSSHWCPY